MKINFNTEYHVNDPRFSDIEIGECFLYDGYTTVFMKIEKVMDSCNCRNNAIDLGTGALFLMGVDDVVRPISVSLNKEG